MNVIRLCAFLWLAALTGGLQAQSTERLFVGVATLFDEQSAQAGLYATALETPQWQRAAWPGFPVRALAASAVTGAPRLFAAGPQGIIRPFPNPTGWQLLGDWHLTEILDLKVDPFEAQTLLAATATGVHVSRDNGKTWRRRNEGLGSTFVDCLVLDPKQKGRVLAGTEEGLYESLNLAGSWHLLAFPGVPIRALLREPESWPGIFWVGTEYQGLYESFDGGKRFDLVEMELDSVSVYALAGGGANAPIYAGLFAHGMYRASSPGENWAPLAGSEALGSVLCILPLEERQTIYVGTAHAGVKRSTDHGRTWESFGLEGQPVRALLLGEREWSLP